MFLLPLFRLFLPLSTLACLTPLLRAVREVSVSAVLERARREKTPSRKTNFISCMNSSHSPC